MSGRTMIILVISTALIAAAFYYGCVVTADHNEAQGLVVAFAFASALAWALSVPGALIWDDLDLVCGAVWNGWFNLFAAAFAAVSAGCATI